MTHSHSIAAMAPSEADVITRVRAFVQENFLYMYSNFQLADDDCLLEKGVLDSMSIMEMVSFVEAQFGVTVLEEEITETNFGSVAGIARYIGQKRARAAA